MKAGEREKTKADQGDIFRLALSPDYAAGCFFMNF